MSKVIIVIILLLSVLWSFSSIFSNKICVDGDPNIDINDIHSLGIEHDCRIKSSYICCLPNQDSLAPLSFESSLCLGKNRFKASFHSKYGGCEIFYTGSKKIKVKVNGGAINNFKKFCDGSFDPSTEITISYKIKGGDIGTFTEVHNKRVAVHQSRQ